MWHEICERILLTPKKKFVYILRYDGMIAAFKNNEDVDKFVKKHNLKGCHLNIIEYAPKGETK